MPEPDAKTYEEAGQANADLLIGVYGAAEALVASTMHMLREKGVVDDADFLAVADRIRDKASETDSEVTATLLRQTQRALRKNVAARSQST